MEVIQAIGFIFSSSWDFFTEVTVPGFEFSFASLFVGLFLASLGLRFLFMMLGVSFGGGGDIDNVERFSDYHRTGFWPDRRRR